jgi:hypothetical protein
VQPDAGWARPRAAAALYGVSRGTLHAWARAGLIGVSHPAGARITLYRTADIAAVLAAGARARTVVPCLPAVTPPPPAPAAYRWQADAFWTGGPAAPHAAPDGRQQKDRRV